MFSQREHNTSNLPSWFESPASVDSRQASLFSSYVDEVLAALRVSVDDLARWHERGWVSFGPDFGERLEQTHVNEIHFVRDVTRFGLGDAWVATLLDLLPRPMNFDPTQVAYSFTLGWVQAVISHEPDVEDLLAEHLDEWLVKLAEDDFDSLMAIRNRVNELIATTEEAEE